MSNINWQNVLFLMITIYSFLLGFHSFARSNKELKIKLDWKDTLFLLIILIKSPKGAILVFVLIPLFIGMWFSHIVRNS